MNNYHVYPPQWLFAFIPTNMTFLALLLDDLLSYIIGIRWDSKDVINAAACLWRFWLFVNEVELSMYISLFCRHNYAKICIHWGSSARTPEQLNNQTEEKHLLEFTKSKTLVIHTSDQLSCHGESKEGTFWWMVADWAGFFQCRWLSVMKFHARPPHCSLEFSLHLNKSIDNYVKLITSDGSLVLNTCHKYYSWSSTQLG